MPLQGMDRQKYLNNKFGGQDKTYKIYKNINEVGKKNGIFFQFDKISKTPNSFLSHKLLALGHKKGKQDQIIESLFFSYFVEGKDIGRIQELVKIGEQNKLDTSETIEYLRSSDGQSSLLQEEVHAKSMGIRGVPCFIINKKYVLFGAQDKDKFIDLFNNLIK